MRRGMFLKLAADNIKRNRGTYIPYMITCICTIAMMYMMLFITQSPDLSTAVPSAQEVSMIMFLGAWVIAIFSTIFLLYSNSFLMKRRQKELGLYNILGMEKKHISRMMCLETVITSLCSFAGGILVGILGSKLAILLLFKLLHVPAVFGFYVSGGAIFLCAVAFGVIFLLTLLNNMRKVHLAQPVELLRGSNVGEKEPKAKWLMALIGVICLGAGYYIAITTESPLDALLLFFVAVLLVMAGTYLLFTAGSIAFLKMLRWKKSFYYKTKNFTAVSGMLYRMKQNAVGLASICILSTGVLMMLSATICLNFGIDDTMNSRFPYDATYTVSGISREEGENLRKIFEETIAENQIPCEQQVVQSSVTFACLEENGRISVEKAEGMSEKIGYITVVPAVEYEHVMGKSAGLADGEILGWSDGMPQNDVLEINDLSYKVKSWLKEWPLYKFKLNVFKNPAIIVTDADFEKLYNLQKEIYKKYGSSVSLDMGIDIKGTKDEKISYGHILRDALKEYIAAEQEAGNLSEAVYMISGIRDEEYQYYYSNYGGLFFLGIFLGTLFLLGASMIIYYKQMSEGYEDKDRFEIMQKVGMNRKEVKSTIRRQILLVFFLPLVTAVVHICAAFPMVRRLLLLMGMANTQLFVMCTAGTILAFAVVYSVIYCLTAKSYYKIVERS